MIPHHTEKYLQELTQRISTGRMSPDDALTTLIRMLPVLQRRTKALRAYKRFADAVNDEDRLRVQLGSMKLWRRKVIDRGVPTWVRSIPPE